MSNLKARVAKLEEVANPKEYGAITIFYENRVREQGENGADVTVSADYYLNKDRTEPVTHEEISELNKKYICFLPIRLLR